MTVESVYNTCIFFAPVGISQHYYYYCSGIRIFLKIKKLSLYNNTLADRLHYSRIHSLIETVFSALKIFSVASYFSNTFVLPPLQEDYDNKTQPLKSAERSQRRRKRSPEEGPSGAGGGAKSLRANAPIRGDVSYISLSDQLALRPENRDYPETKKRKPLMLTTVAIPVFNISKGENDTVRAMTKDIYRL